MSNYQCLGRDCPCQQDESPCHAGGCKEDLRRALDLLCGRQLRDLVDFDRFAFLSDFFLMGTTLHALEHCQTPCDNLNHLDGDFHCSGDGCESVTISGPLAYPVVGSSTADNVVSQAVLCKLAAVVFEPKGHGEEKEENFRAISQFFLRLLQPQQSRDCQCLTLVEALTDAAATRSVSLTAGPLLVQNAAILGQIDDILVLANANDHRFYLVCARKISFIG